MVKRTYRRKTMRISPYLRDVQKFENYKKRSDRYAAQAEAYSKVGAQPRSLLAEAKLTGYGGYTGGMYTGHGGYSKTLGRMMRSKAAKSIGRTLLREGGQAAMRYAGSGAYNSLIGGGGAGGSWTDQVPSFSSAGDETGALTITHREYVTDVFGPPTSAFTLQSYALNPGLEQSFPWLSQIAANYEEYEFGQLMYTYRSTTTDIGNSSNGQCGTIIMATNYNASAQTFQDKITMMEYDAAMSSKVTEHMQHGVECDPGKRSGTQGMYVRTQPLPVNQDIKTYDHGLYQFALANTPTTYANFSLGEIWVSYTVTLRKPRFYTNRGLSQDKEVYVSSNTTTYANNATTLSILGADQAWYKALNNNIGGLLQVNGAGGLNYIFPASWAGQVEFVMTVTFVAGTVISIYPTMSVNGQVVLVGDMYGTATASTPHGNSIAGPVGFTSTGAPVVYRYHVRVGAAVGGVNNSVVIARTDSPVNIVNASLEIVEYNPSFSVSNTNSAIAFVNSSGVAVSW